MMLLNRDKENITQKIYIFLAMVAFVQVLIFVVVFNSIGLEDRFIQKDIAKLAWKVETKQTQILMAFTKRWANISYMKETIASAEKIYKYASMTNRNLVIDEALAASTLNMMKTIGSTGAFVLLDSEPHILAPKEIFYVRDYNTKIQANNNSDILLEMGTVKLARSLNLAINSYWSPKFQFVQKETMGIYNRILAEYKKNTNASMADLGLWTDAYPVNNGGTMVITYIMPLIDSETKNYYGCIGVEVAIDFIIANLFDSNPQADKSIGASAIVMYKSSSEQMRRYKMEAFDGLYYERILDDNIITLDNSKYSKLGGISGACEMYELSEPLINWPTIVVVSQLNLYGANSPYKTELWYYMHILDVASVTAESRYLARAVWLPIAGVILIGLFGGMGSGLLVSAQVKGLLKKLKAVNADPFKPISKTGIIEIDDIIDSIESLNKIIEYSASRMQQILGAMNLSIGAIEIDLVYDTVFLIGSASELLLFTSNATSMPYSEFKTEFDSFIEKSEFFGKGMDIEVETDADIYKVINDSKTTYVSIHTKFAGAKQLKVVTDVTETIERIIRIEYERDHDSLTGIWNRKAFKQKIDRLIEKKDISKGAMIMWDLDNLKYINDTFGHDFGDYYICETARVITTIPFKDVISARFSGDEFFAFIYNISSKEQVINLVDEIKNRFASTSLTLAGGKEIKMRATTGIAWYPDDSTNVDELIKYADFAMYVAKANQKGTISQFSIKSYNKDYILLCGTEDFDRFLDEKQVKFAFQPIVDVQTGEVFSYEALLRPTSENLKTVFDVMRLAKSQSKLHDLEVLTWNTVLTFCKKNMDIFKEKKIFINSIPNTLFTTQEREYIESNFSDLFTNIVVEFLENDQVSDECLRSISVMRSNWGCSIAIDDFGSGYSTDAALLRLNPDYVKIDMSIVRDVDRDMNRRQLITNIIEYTKPRNIKIIAEGVETISELKILIALGVDYVQGFYLGKPSFEIVDLEQSIKQLVQEIYITYYQSMF